VLSPITRRGHFNVDGHAVATGVEAVTQDTFLLVGALEQRYSFTLSFFSPWVFLLGSDAERAAGMHYDLRGPGVASMSHGPLGHPGDAEYDCWTFSRVEFGYRFFRDALRVALRGQSGIGTPGFMDDTQALPPVEVDIAFVVVRPRLQEFLRGTDPAWSHFQERLDTLPVDADVQRGISNV
jgi:hypothetical protein